MTFLGPAREREWVAVMVGDVVRDGWGQPWRVQRAESEMSDGVRVVWVELSGGTPRQSRTLRIPNAHLRIQMHEGPGWGLDGTGEQAMHWAVREVTRVLGGSIIT